jgi:poly(A) polymerase
MIKKLIKRLLGQGQPAASPAPPAEPPKPVIPLGVRTEVPAEVHGIDPAMVDERAAKVVATLKAAGHEAYIVGGAVRDLLVGRRPKDFDVATNATPEEVKALFRRAFIIGRRFRIVHVVFGRGRDHEVIEVSTFRAYLDASEATQVDGNERTSRADLAGQAHAVDASGRVLRDNVWGPQVEDAARRDFTVNAMYYDPQSRTVVDYHHGLADVRARVLRLIGDPETRYREDPVRIVRAVRFAAKLGFTLEPRTRAPIDQAKALLANVPISRMFDEMIKLLQTGHALASLQALESLGLARGVFPVLDAVLDPQRSSEQSLAFVRLALGDTDRRVEEGKPVAPSFLLACLLWHDVLAGWRQRQEAGEHLVPALQQAIDAVFDARIGDVSGRGKLGVDMREIWMMQPRFERRQANTARSMVEQPRFRAAFDFLRLRADAGELPTDLAEWWEDYSLGSEEEREALLEAVRGSQPRGRGHASPGAAPPGRRGARAAAQPLADGAEAAIDDADLPADAHGDAPSDDPVAADAGAPAARKRRRRRRKPSAAAGAGAAAAGGEGSIGDKGPSGSA